LLLQVLTELNSYVTQSRPPDDAENVHLTLHYLEACRDFFEEGFLFRKKFTNMKSEAISSIQKGFTHFEKWYNELSDG